MNIKFQQNKALVDQLITEYWEKNEHGDVIADHLNRLGIPTMFGKNWTRQICSGYARKKLNLQQKFYKKTKESNQLTLADSIDIYKDIYPEDDNFVFEFNNNLFTNSLYIAKKFNKRHSNVLAAIREIENKNKNYNSSAVFSVESYIDSSGKENVLYNLNKDATILLIMGFTGDEAYKLKIEYINRFNEMESIIKQINTTVIEPLNKDISTRELLRLFFKDAEETEIRLVGKIQETKTEILDEVKNIKQEILTEVSDKLQKETIKSKEITETLRDIRTAEYAEQPAPQMTLRAKIRRIISAYVNYTFNNPTGDNYKEAYNRLDQEVYWRLKIMVKTLIKNSEKKGYIKNRFDIFEEENKMEEVYKIASEIFKIEQ